MMIKLINCIKCKNDKPAGAFYLSSIRKSGVLGECKDCVCERVKIANNKPHRKNWFNSSEFKAINSGKFAKHVSKYPRRYAARAAARDAISSGLLVNPSECSNCGSCKNIESHHDDYNKPLDVRWLCKKCHGLWHRYNKPVYTIED